MRWCQRCRTSGSWVCVVVLIFAVRVLLTAGLRGFYSPRID